jgi:N-methylhydantoinase A/oxoprolinase/acetone carboxylase beta subunit
MSTAKSYRVGVDIGGTFTDIVLLGVDGTIHTKKISSSVDNYARAIVEGLIELFTETGLSGSAIEEIRHGTTVASNAILEHKGARVGLITTKGFRDVLEIRTLRMPKLYDLAWRNPPPSSIGTSVRWSTNVSTPAAGSNALSTPGISSAPSTRSLPKRSRRSPCACSIRSPTRDTS